MAPSADCVGVHYGATQLPGEYRAVNADHTMWFQVCDDAGSSAGWWHSLRGGENASAPWSCNDAPQFVPIYTLLVGKFPIETTIPSGFPSATFDYRRILKEKDYPSKAYKIRRTLW